jgi:hypothetical protein
MDIINGWFFVTIVTPLMSPVIGLLLFRLLPIPAPPSGLKVMMLVKDGQLGWTVIAMGASAIYESWEAEEAHKHVPGWAFGGLIGLMVCATLVAAGGAAFSTPLLTTAPGGWKAWAKHYGVFVGSAVLTIGTVVLYTVSHFAVSP